ncbi:MAG: tetratricopeptide repeat protein [bacterium]|jgi:tetratricopeptide (TPR) repeat protein|mmetsp:Transcript_15940/g.45647  ORF Transcript_15940/g.45647 Transcript_15940/m.45647 type:complete len:411 (+) Transcript_15940:32-1264(+)
MFARAASFRADGRRTVTVMQAKSRSGGSNKKSPSKGFSDAKKQASKPKAGKPKQNIDRNTAQQQSRAGAPFLEVQNAELTSPGEIEKNLAFEKRLEELGRQAEVQKSALRAEAAKVSDVLAVPNYDNPPPLIETIQSAGNRGASATSMAEEGSVGPSQVVLGALSLILVGIFIVANGGSELGYSAPRSTSQTALAPEQRNDLKAELERMQARMEAAPEDLEALESAAVLNTQLGDYKKASELLGKLVASKPADQEVLRLLGEVEFQLGDAKKASETFRSAFKASGDKSLEVLTLLTDSLMASGKQRDAVEEVKELRASAGSSLGNVELGMLQAKLLAQWRGHSPEAIQLYEELCDANPDDFRPFLGRGLLLKAEGRMADAQRMFVQARFLAPASSKATVEALIKGADVKS